MYVCVLEAAGVLSSCAFALCLPDNHLTLSDKQGLGLPNVTLFCPLAQGLLLPSLAFEPFFQSVLLMLALSISAFDGKGICGNDSPHPSGDKGAVDGTWQKRRLHAH